MILSTAARSPLCLQQCATTTTQHTTHTSISTIRCSPSLAFFEKVLREFIPHRIMAPHQDECWDKHVHLARVCDRLSDDLAMMEENVELSGGSNSKATLMEDDARKQPMDELWMHTRILFRRVYTSVNEANFSTDENTTLPSHWPSKQVHFPHDMVTEVRTRPFTDVVDVPTLFYSLDDIKRFKREYRHLLKKKILHIQRLELSQEESLTRHHHDNSSWRRTVSRRFSGSTSSATSSIVPSASGCVEYSSDMLYDDSDSYDSKQCEENEFTGSPSDAGIFSSVMDLTREALSMFKYQHQRIAPPSSTRFDFSLKTSSHVVHNLVDTLYLF